MSYIFLEMTMTLDGFTAAPAVSLEDPLGVGGERVQEWRGGNVVGAFGGGGTEGAPDASPDEIDRSVAARMFETTGAIVMGRRTFDVGEGRWGDDPVFEGRPVFVVTTREREPFERGGSRYAFVTGGVAEAVARADDAASAASVCILGGADVARQALALELVHEVRLHLAPVLLGGGTRLFPDSAQHRIELDPLGVEQGSLATHLRYRVRPYV